MIVCLRCFMSLMVKHRRIVVATFISFSCDCDIYLTFGALCGSLHRCSLSVWLAVTYAHTHTLVLHSSHQYQQGGEETLTQQHAACAWSCLLILDMWCCVMYEGKPVVHACTCYHHNSLRCCVVYDVRARAFDMSYTYVQNGENQTPWASWPYSFPRDVCSTSYATTWVQSVSCPSVLQCFSFSFSSAIDPPVRPPIYDTIGNGKSQ